MCNRISSGHVPVTVPCEWRDRRAPDDPTTADERYTNLCLFPNLTTATNHSRTCPGRALAYRKSLPGFVNNNQWQCGYIERTISALARGTVHWGRFSININWEPTEHKPLGRLTSCLCNQQTTDLLIVAQWRHQSDYVKQNYLSKKIITEHIYRETFCSYFTYGFWYVYDCIATFCITPSHAKKS